VLVRRVGIYPLSEKIFVENDLTFGPLVPTVSDDDLDYQKA